MKTYPTRSQRDAMFQTPERPQEFGALLTFDDKCPRVLVFKSIDKNGVFIELSQESARTAAQKALDLLIEAIDGLPMRPRFFLSTAALLEDLLREHAGSYFNGVVKIERIRYRTISRVDESYIEKVY